MAVKALKVSRYAWEGTDRTGVKITGELSGHNPALIKAQLRQQGIKPGKVWKKPGSLLRTDQPIKALDISLFTRQMATLTKAGVPLLQAFEIIGTGFDKPAMGKLLDTLKQEVAGGNSFAVALRKQPQYFDELYCSLVDAGEQAGALDTLLARLATYQEQREKLKARLRKAMTYPLAVMFVALIVSAIVLLKVVPQFQSMFAGLGAELPAFTLAVIGLSEFMQGWWRLLLLVLVATAWAVPRLLRRSPTARERLDRLLLKLPLLGSLLYKSAVARYARTLAITFAAGVPLVDALDSVAGATGNAVHRNAVKRIRQDVASGLQLNVSMRSSGVFPNMAIQLTAIGEETGALDVMLDKVASYYEEDVDNRVDTLASLMEPFIMVVLGLIVGSLVVAMYLPIFQLGTAI